MAELAADHRGGRGSWPLRLMWLVVAGASLVTIAVLLYVSGASRAVGVVLFVIGAASLGAALVVRIRGRWPGRMWFVFVGALLALIALYGVALWIYALITPDTAV